MSAKQLLFGPRTVNVLGVLMLAGIGLRLYAWSRDDATCAAVANWLMAPFVLLMVVLLLVVLPWTWLTSRRR